MSRKFSKPDRPRVPRRGSHYVQSGHHEPGTVADHADVAVELHVIEPLLGGLLFERIPGLRFRERPMPGMPKRGVAVERDLPVERDDLPIARASERIDLDEGCVLGCEHVPQPDQDPRRFDRKPCRRRDPARLHEVDPDADIDRHLDQGLRPGRGDLLDVHPARRRRHREETPVRAVEEIGDVVLLGDIAGLGDQDPMHAVPFDVHPEDLVRDPRRVFRLGREFDPARLASSAGLDLRLHDNRPPDVDSGGAGFVRRRCDAATGNRHAVRGEEVARLVFQEVHRNSFLAGGGAGSSLVGVVDR